MKKFILKSEAAKQRKQECEQLENRQRMLEELIDGLGLDILVGDILPPALSYENVKKLYSCMVQRDEYYEKLLNIRSACRDNL